MQEVDVVVAVVGIVVSVIIVVGGCTTLSSIVGVGGELFIIVRLIVVWFVSTQSYHLDSRRSRITFLSC